MSQKRREEAANTTLATCLSELLGAGFAVTPEGAGRADRKLVDVTVRIDKLEIFLEAKHDNFGAAVKSARARWDLAKPPAIVGAVSYSPPYLYDFDDAVRRGATIDFAMSGDRNDNLAAMKRTGGIYDLAQALRRPHSVIAPNEDDDIDKAIGNIRGALAVFCRQVKLGQPGTLARLAALLQADFNNGDKEEDVLEQTALMAGLILFGAALFQTALSGKNPLVSPAHEVLKDRFGVPELGKHWREIVEKINYAAVFNLAADILDKGIEYGALKTIVQAAAEVADVARDGVDLMGRIYHELLTDAKSLGAFYTSIPSATLMAGLALNPHDWKNTDWADADSVGKLRIADPACGSGTLLAAASWQVLDNFSRAHFQQHGGRIGGVKKAHPRARLQKLLIEDVVWGYDILETAAHLSAAALGMMSPETDFRKAHIYRAIIGNTSGGVAAGSLELLEGDMPIFYRDRNRQIENEHAESLPPLDLCIMNPPFVRGQKGHESFGFLRESEGGNVQDRVKKLSVIHDFVHDGQGPAFIALACLKRMKTAFVKEGGKLAAILPATAAVGMGSAWHGVRQKIGDDFDLETVIVSREKGRPNFSENTHLQECMLVARKRKKGEEPAKTALFVVLRKNPGTVDAANATAKAILRARDGGQLLGNLHFDDNPVSPPGDDSRYIGQYARLSWHGQSAWRGLSFVNLHLAVAAERFAKTGSLMPFAAKGKISLKPLGDLAHIGSNRMHKYTGDPDPQKRNVLLSATATRYAGYYPVICKKQKGISQKDMRHIAEHPQCHWLPVPGKEEWAENFFAKAGRVVLCESFGFTTMRRLAVLLSKPVQASHYWPIKLNNESEDKLKALTLWLNSTPALLLIAHASSSTKGAKVTFSQKAAEELMVPDLDKLSRGNLQKAAVVFGAIAKGPGLLPLPQMANDKERAKIDRMFSDIFPLGDLSPLRKALATEPIIRGA